MATFDFKGDVMEPWSGDVYCVRCRDKREMLNGFIRVSDSGRRMAQGICNVCGDKVNRILGKQQTPPAQPTVEDIMNRPASQVIASEIGDPNLPQINAMAERVLKMLLEIDPEMENKIEMWEDKRVEKKLYKKWRRKIGNEIANEIENLNIDLIVSQHGLLLEAIVDIKRQARDIAKGV